MPIQKDKQCNKNVVKYNAFRNKLLDVHLLDSDDPVFFKNGFDVLEVVKTNFDVGKTSFNIQKRRSVQLASRFEILSNGKLEASQILTHTLKSKIWRKLENDVQTPQRKNPKSQILTKNRKHEILQKTSKTHPKR